VETGDAASITPVLTSRGKQRDQSSFSRGMKIELVHPTGDDRGDEARLGLGEAIVERHLLGRHGLVTRLGGQLATDDATLRDPARQRPARDPVPLGDDRDRAAASSRSTSAPSSGVSFVRGRHPATLSHVSH
jgi:hypothetical protein